jgi:photosystem II stability/assembly factor-like uncharacterized protein
MGIAHTGPRTWFAVGAGNPTEPSIIRSTDDGATWTACACGTEAAMFAVHFKDTFGVIVGAGGVILRTTDGGATWTRVGHTVTRGVLRGVRVMDSTTAVVVALSGMILRTTDRGATWAEVATGNSEVFHAIGAWKRTAVAVGVNGTIW